MKPVERSEILDWMTYAEKREQLRADAMRVKATRRIVVGDAFTFLFENRETVRYQVHEMLRAEQIVREADIVHELETYNELLGGAGELGCSLLIGIEDEDERGIKLKAWVGLPKHIYARLEDGTVVRPTFDPRQVGDERLSSVQYLKLAVGAKAPMVVGIDLPGIEAETRLTAEQRAALQADLDSA